MRIILPSQTSRLWPTLSELTDLGEEIVFVASYDSDIVAIYEEEAHELIVKDEAYVREVHIALS